eukprot:TRINITY_DN2002_c0_g1_i7.p3 TRINITY_DN2002_c0_g1~~TRINITY_DN2002_c0_g1_i7.p3  ORF type:complete len:227 (+),score=43.95 TRINITY_DN2002_c0_g1_i7:1174-1854(+)
MCSVSQSAVVAQADGLVETSGEGANEQHTTDIEQHTPADIERLAELEDASAVFRYLVLFQAMLASFAHGANDTANATGPFVAIWQVHEHLREAEHSCAGGGSSFWIMAVAGGFVFLGINVCGSRVIKTVGEGLVKMNFQRAYCVGFSATMSVVLATILGFPVSTTHCQVGSVVCIGVAEFGYKELNWATIGKIGITWIVTLPFAAMISSALYAILVSSSATNLTAY